MVQAPFEGSILKLKRAQDHFNTLIKLVTKFGEENPPEINVSRDKGYEEVMMPLSKTPIPEEIPLVTGDIIHNLRSSLDLMMCDVMRVQTKSSDKIKFPFAASSDDLEKQLAGEFRRAGDAAVELVRSYKPFKGGNIALRGLHDLDIMDKHKAIIPITQKGLYAMTEITVCMGDEMVVLMDGNIIHRGPNPNPPEKIVTMNARFPQDYNFRCIVFSDLTPFPDEPILHTLENMGYLTSGIIKAFRDLFDA